jgi:hypothetical protein
MGKQIEQIRDFKRELEESEGCEFSLEEAARRWIKKYAQRFRDEFGEDVKTGDSQSN